VRIEFERAGRDCAVEVELGVNEDPAPLGCPDYARGFPVCRATISPPARGYADFLGWVQLVNSTDLAGEFRIDPFEPLGTVPQPLCFYGFAPTLFDAPHREPQQDVDWLAHSFLCGLGDDPLDGRSEVDAILGFSWGFRIRDGKIVGEGPSLLTPQDWNRHHDYLQEAFPRWSFLSGFSEGAASR
jgi:hypothetical protein